VETTIQDLQVFDEWKSGVWVSAGALLATKGAKPMASQGLKLITSLFSNEKCFRTKRNTLLTRAMRSRTGTHLQMGV